jgi:hypothetical protein
MLPHPRGEAESIATAFYECALGLQALPTEELDQEVQNWIKQLQAFLDTSGIEGSAEDGLWLLKAQQLTEEQKFELSGIIDELAAYLSQARY